MNTRDLFLIAIGILISYQSFSQDRLEGGRPYKPGESFSAPVVGMNVTVPLHWRGYYAHDSEIFTMSNDTTIDVRCMYFVNQTNLKKLASNWKKGFPLASGLSIELDGPIDKKEDVMMAQIKVPGRAEIEGQLLARCGPYGYCITAMVFGQVVEMKKFHNKLESIVSTIEFVKPIPRSEIDVMDWQKELTGKYLFAYQREQSSKKESQVWLNLDGTFKSKISQTGMFKAAAGDYKGTKKGSYLIYNKKNGQPAKLVLLYKNLPEVSLPLEMKDKQYYINDQIFYFSAQ